MNTHKLYIKRFIIFYITIFCFAGTLLITLFSYWFGLFFIQKKYTTNYVQATFQSFDNQMENLIKQINLISFDISSNSNVLRLVTNTTIATEKKKEDIQNYLEYILSDYAEIRQIDIITPFSMQLSYIASPYAEQSALNQPSGYFTSEISNRSVCLYDHCITDQFEHPYLVFGRNSDIGLILIYIDESVITEMYEPYLLKDSTIYLENNEILVASSNSIYLNRSSGLLLKELSDTGSNVLTYTHPVEFTYLKNPLTLTYVLSEENLYETTNALNRLLLASICIFVPICLIIVFFISKTLFQSLNTLNKNLVQFSNDYHHIFALSKNSELEYLENNFRFMSEKIRFLIANIEFEKDQKRIAELKALQYQINPHFIYNSIDAISWMAKLKKPYEDIEKLSYNLGLFFRLGLHKGDTFITIEEELQHVQSYLAIEQFRFPDRFQVTAECEPDLLQLHILKIILQPIVENSIIHGFAGVSYIGKISIRVYTSKTDSDLIIFEVTDNGIGIQTNGSLPKSQSKYGGYGLRNISERLSLEYGEATKLNFQSIPGKGTTVSFGISKKLL